MPQSSYLREQAERCRRLARDCTDPHLRDNLLQRPKNTPPAPTRRKRRGREFSAPAETTTILRPDRSQAIFVRFRTNKLSRLAAR
jgi:hypothetical protein